MRRVKIPKSQIFCFALIMIVCIIAIVEALYYVMNPNIQDNKNIADNSLSNAQITDMTLVDNFDDVFQNSFKNTNTSEEAEKIDADKLWVNPDCGLKTRGEKETLASLYNLVKAAKELREEYK